MDVDVDVTTTGQLRVIVDGVSWAPMPVEAVQAMAALIPAAQSAATRQTMTTEMRALTDALVSSGPDLAASLEVTAAGVEATVDPVSYERVQQVLGVEPDAEGALKRGLVVVRKPSKPAPEPTPQPTPEPTPNPTP